MKLEFINKLQPSFPEKELLNPRTWSWLGRAIQEKLDARGPDKIPSDAFQLTKEIKIIMDKIDTVKTKI